MPWREFQTFLALGAAHRSNPGDADAHPLALIIHAAAIPNPTEHQR